MPVFNGVNTHSGPFGVIERYSLPSVIFHKNPLVYSVVFGFSSVTETVFSPSLTRSVERLYFVLRYVAFERSSKTYIPI